MGVKDEISAVIVNYNSGRIIEKCFDGISEVENTIIVDNASWDGSVAKIRDKYPDFMIIRNSKNEGYGRAVNRALTSVNTPFVLTVSPDTTIDPKVLHDLYSVIKEDSTTACVAPGLLTKGQGIEFWVMGPGELSCSKATFEIGGNFCTWFASAAVALYRTDALKKVGGFDENIFAYTEDCDLSYRLTKIGYNLIIMPNITAHHINSGSTQRSVKQHWRKDWNFAWSTLYLLKKHKGSKRARNEGMSLLLKRAPKALFYLFTLNVKRFTRDGATFMGTLNFLLGNKPTPRD